MLNDWKNLSSRRQLIFLIYSLSIIESSFYILVILPNKIPKHD